MISAIFIINSSGTVIVSRVFREDVKCSVSEVFRSKIINVDPKNLKNPILTLGSTTFLHEKRGEIYFVAVTRNNSDASVILQYLNTLISMLHSLIAISPSQVLKDYHLMDNFLLIYELLDLTIDQGFAREVDTSFLLSKIYSPISKATDGRYRIDNEANHAVEIVQKSLSLLGALGVKSYERMYEKNVIALHLNEYVQVKDKTDVKILGEVVSISTVSTSVAVEFDLDTRVADQSSIVLENITVPLALKVKEPSLSTKFNFSTIIAEPIQPILNYSAQLLFDELPIIVVGSYKQLARDKFEVNMKLECRYPANQIAKEICVQIPVPKNTIRVTDIPLLRHQKTEDELQDNARKDGYLQWKLTFVAGNQDIKICKMVHVDLKSKLSDWISDREDVTVSFQLEDVNLTGYTIKSFNVGKSLDEVSSKIVKSQVLSHNIYGFKL